MKFLLTMNMASAKGHPVHQMTVEHNAKSLRELWEDMTDNEFIMCTLYYKMTNDDMQSEWVDRGKVLINTSCIGKAQEFVDYYGDRDERY